MKIGLAIAPENALPSAFVVFRDKLEVSLAKAARLGYDGVELALLDAQQVDRRRIRAAARCVRVDDGDGPFGRPALRERRDRRQHQRERAREHV